ncbi:MAG: hypothetical protein LUE89_04375 [Clostridiales bacterium]|nr:hypothetical protein [Clostridiales bacterium]
MKPYLPILNSTLELADCQDKWFLDETYHCWCLEDILYTMKATISNLGDYILNHRRRMKPCTSFDTLGMDSGENQEFGTPEDDYLHFNPYIPALLDELRADFPGEVAQVYDSWATVPGDAGQATRRSLINPMDYMSKLDQCSPAGHYRINGGACDADTAFTISMSLAVKLANLGKDVEYHLIWDNPHCEADYPFEVCDWVEKISGRHEVPEVSLEGSRA